jgi:flavin-dependent dehydrogenase
MERVDLAIVGGGPVGLATAIFAARAGMRATVLEARSEPIDKACGEGIMPRGVALLRELGVELRGRPFAGIRFLSRGVIAEGRFPGEPGLGVRRTALSEALRARARALGVAIASGCALRSFREHGDGVALDTSAGPLSAPWLIGADGLHSLVRRACGLDGGTRARSRFGMRRHFRVEPWSPLVEVYWADDAEAYVTPVARDEIGIAILWRGEERRFDALLARFPALAARVDGCAPASTVRGAGPFARGALGCQRGRVALVGDAAGALDPLTGEGITVGLLSARALVAAIAEGAPLARYERERHAILRTPRALARLLLVAAERPLLRHAFVSLVARHPALFDRLVALNAGEGFRSRALAVGDPVSGGAR